MSPDDVIAAIDATLAPATMSTEKGAAAALARLAASNPALAATGALGAYELYKGWDVSKKYGDPNKFNTKLREKTHVHDSTKKKKTKGGPIVPYTKIDKPPATADPKDPLASKRRGKVCHDSDLLFQQDEHRMDNLKLVMGKSENVAAVQAKSIENMLKMLCGTQQMNYEFSGFMSSAYGERSTTFMVFRHNLGNETDQRTYSDVTNVSLLKPVAGAVTLPGSKTAPDNNPYWSHDNNSTWFHPMNRAAFEDCAWNLNRLKLVGGTYPQHHSKADGSYTYGANDGMNGAGGTLPDPQLFLGDNLHVMEDTGFYEGKMRRKSMLYMNNDLADNKEWPLITDTGSMAAHRMRRPRTNQYNMVFNQGKLTYDFTNKGDGPVQATIIVYKVKRQNTYLSAKLADFDQNIGALTLSDKGIPRFLYPPIKEGLNRNFTKREFAAGPTNGVEDLVEDYFLDVSKEFLPIVSDVKQSTLPFTEQQRVDFVMSAGGHRTVELVFGGDSYNPINCTLKYDAATALGGPEVTSTGAADNNTPLSKESEVVPVLDDHSYVVCLSIHGSKTTRMYAKDGAGDEDPPVRFGDMYDAAELMWKARYVEDISAAQYLNSKKRVRTRGTSHVYNGRDSLVTGEFPGVILPLDRTVRLPQSNGGHVKMEIP